MEKKTIILYETEAEINGRETELFIFPTGRVHEQVQDDDDGHDDYDHGGHDQGDHGHGGHDHDHDDDHDRDDDD
ncbi:MAG: hypothetical protein IH889_05850 [Planctomycetes bacterium]|nr:hypothetical protein [Planctomycetota bacterium]